MTPTLTCQELVELVTEYFEGALPPEDRARFEAHLGGCQGCRAHLTQMQTTLKLLGALTEDSLSEETKAELLNLFRDWKKDTPATA